MKPIITLLRRETSALLGCVCLVSANWVLASEPLVVLSADGNHTASVGTPGRISYRRTSSNTVEHTFYICHPQALAFSEDGKLLAAGRGRNGNSAKIKVWRISDHQQLCEIIISGEGAKLIAVSPDGRLLSSARNTKTAWKPGAFPMGNCSGHASFHRRPNRCASRRTAKRCGFNAWTEPIACSTRRTDASQPGEPRRKSKRTRLAVV